MAAGGDRDFDRCQPFFFFYDDDDEDRCAWDFNQSTAPGEDIWKKFELLPTPPLPPNWARPTPLLPSGGPCHGGTAGSPDDDDAEGPGVLSDPIHGAEAVVLRDCMWSGFDSAGATPDKSATEKPAAEKLGGFAGGASLPSARLPAASRAVPPEPGPGGRSPGEGGRAGVGGAGPCSVPLVVTSAVVDPADLHDDDDDDEEDGEIDVVTVESVAVRAVYNTNTVRQYNQQQQQQRSTPAYASRGHIPLVHQHHNYAAPPPENPPAAKRFGPDPRPAGAAVPPPSYRARWRTHNHLERQRRRDIRNGFLWLRDHVPELAHNDKAGMVQILQKATEYSRTLRRQEEQLEETKRQLKIRQRELLKRLESARNLQAKRS
ncbi:N-myc proto-oncogene protein-like [Petromyzon marinus]|uniref:N-myc proto-oncogene protein-like n=1 Tax=Petromyzon marinus TaxID=7757 RepID=UPI003F6E4855